MFLIKTAIDNAALAAVLCVIDVQCSEQFSNSICDFVCISCDEVYISSERVFWEETKLKSSDFSGRIAH